MLISPLDIVALVFFVGAWTGYALILEWSAPGRTSLNARMDGFREAWVRRILTREMRMVDMQIMSALQNGTAFYASTSLLAVGGSLTLLRSTGEIVSLVAELPLAIPTGRALWEAKTIGLTVIFVYAFFKFAWAHRLFNYVAILLGALPTPAEKDTPDAETHVKRTTRLFQSAGRNFNRGQRAFFFALGYLGWFIGPWALIVATAAVVVVMWRRQFASDSWRALDQGT